MMEEKEDINQRLARLRNEAVMRAATVRREVLIELKRLALERGFEDPDGCSVYRQMLEIDQGIVDGIISPAELLSDPAMLSLALIGLPHLGDDHDYGSLLAEIVSSPRYAALMDQMSANTRDLMRTTAVARNVDERRN